MNGVDMVTSWLTTPVLFCVLNVMIGAIFLRSKLYPPPPTNALVRVPSFLERVKSFNRSSHHSPQPEPAAREVEEPPHPVASSKPDAAAREIHHVPDAVMHAAAREVEEPPHPVASSKTDAAAREIHHAPDAVMNAAAREKHNAPDTVASGTDAPNHVVRTKSEAVVRAAPAASALQKSASERISILREEEEEERWRPATVRERVGGDEEVDEKADEFINNFRQQLKLQRMDSIMRARR